MPELYSSYSIVTDLMVISSLIMKYNKCEIFHFSRAYNNSNPELDLSTICAFTLKSKTYWRYLEFYFDWCLFFKKLSTTLPKHCQWLKQWACLKVQLEAFFHSRSISSVAFILFLLLLIALDFGSLLRLLLRVRYCF